MGNDLRVNEPGDHTMAERKSPLGSGVMLDFQSLLQGDEFNLPPLMKFQLED